MTDAFHIATMVGRRVFTPPRSAMFSVLCDRLLRLGRDEDGAALVITLAIFFLMYLGCCGVFAISVGARERIHLQDACDAAAYSAAVVQADTLSRIATINRAMSWTYVQMTRRQMDFVTYKWLEETVKHWRDDRARAQDWADSTIHPTPAICSLAGLPFKGHLKTDHSFALPQMPPITLYGARGSSVATELDISVRNAGFQLGHVGGDDSFFSCRMPGIGSLASQIRADMNAIKDMGDAIDRLKDAYKEKAETAVREILKSNLADASVSGASVDTLYYCKILEMNQYVEELENNDDEEDRFLSFAGERVRSAFKNSGEVWFKRCSSAGSGFRRGYDWNGDRLKATWEWYSNQWHCYTDEFGEHHVGPFPCPSCDHDSHDRCSCSGFGMFVATVYGDNSKSISGCRDIYETPKRYLARPNKVLKNYFGGDGSIVVGVVRRNSNAWAKMIGAAGMVANGIFSAFDPDVEWSVGFSAAKAGYVTLNESAAGGNMPYHVDWQSGGWQTDSESWNLCQSDWDAILIPVRMATNDARDGRWKDSDDSVFDNAVGDSSSWKPLFGSASMPDIEGLTAPGGVLRGNGHDGTIKWREVSHVAYH